MTPLIICAAITGSAPPRSRTPYHPVIPEEIVAEAVACWRAGAAMIHLHARKADGDATNDPSAYRGLLERIASTGCDAILNISAGDNGGRSTHEERLALASIGAEMVSLDAGSFNIGNRLYDNRPTYVQTMARRLREHAVAAEVEIFDTGHLDMLEALQRDELLPTPTYVQFVFGPPGALKPDARLLPLLVERLRPGTPWAVSCQAPDPWTCLELSMAAFLSGGHVRTGMEDQVFRPDGSHAETNAEMVARWVATAKLWGRPVATPAEARTLLRGG